ARSVAARDIAARRAPARALAIGRRARALRLLVERHRPGSARALEELGVVVVVGEGVVGVEDRALDRDREPALARAAGELHVAHAGRRDQVFGERPREAERDATKIDVEAARRALDRVLVVAQDFADRLLDFAAELRLAGARR